jgi:hypothetical protein
MGAGGHAANETGNRGPLNGAWGGFELHPGIRAKAHTVNNRVIRVEAPDRANGRTRARKSTANDDATGCAASAFGVLLGSRTPWRPASVETPSKGALT